MKNRCDNCHERDAVITLTQVADEQKTTVHLCERCAAERGVETSASLSKVPVANFLASIKNVDVAAALPGPTPVGSCRHCGASLDDFRETGRLGCADCYRSFEGPLRDLLRRLHGSTRHVGERYAVPGADPPSEPSSGAMLREQLRQAIEAERFELAAQIRDQLKASEGPGV